MRTIITFGLTALLFLLAGGPGPGLAETVKVGVVHHVSDAGIFIALEKGYFKEQAIEIDMPRFRSAGDMMAPLGTGELHVAGGGINPGLYNGIARGIQMIVVADKGSLPPGRGYLIIVVRKDLWDEKKVTSVKDLKGRPVATNAANSPTIYQWAKALGPAGLTLADVDLKTIDWPLMIPALQNKAIDAAIISEPLASMAEERNVGLKMLTTDKVTPHMGIAAIIYSKDFAGKKPDLAKRWMTAYLKAVRFYNDALREGGSKREEVVETLIKNTTVKERRMYDRMVWAGLDPNGYVNKESLMDYQRFLQERGEIPKPVPVSQIVDDSYVEAALRVLGKYEAK